MKNRTINEFENRIMDKRVNIIEPSMQNRNKKTLNELQRLPVKYSIGNDYLYTHRIYNIKKKYVNGEITKDQYDKMMKVIRRKSLENKYRIKLHSSNIHNLELMKNKKYK